MEKKTDCESIAREVKGIWYFERVVVVLIIFLATGIVLESLSAFLEVLGSLESLVQTM